MLRCRAATACGRRWCARYTRRARKTARGILWCGVLPACRTAVRVAPPLLLLLRRMIMMIKTPPKVTALGVLRWSSGSISSSKRCCALGASSTLRPSSERSVVGCLSRYSPSSIVMSSYTCPCPSACDAARILPNHPLRWLGLAASASGARGLDKQPLCFLLVDLILRW